MYGMANAELGEASEDEKRLQQLLLKSMLPKDDADERDCILEVRAGTGGEEASLFGVYNMYERFAQKKGWRFEVVDITESDLKGYKEASGSLTGVGVYGTLKFEWSSQSAGPGVWNFSWKICGANETLIWI